jgi:hypothetical protein
MKMNLAAKFSLLAVLFLAAAFFTGCQTLKPIDWDSRVGNYTYDQAVTELGPPDRQARLSDGKVVSKWIRHRAGGTGFNSGMSYYGNNGFGAGQTIGTSRNDQMLQLTFGTNGKLTAWSKNY